jgi:hypothetical protein
VRRTTDCALDQDEPKRQRQPDADRHGGPRGCTLSGAQIVFAAPVLAASGSPGQWERRWPESHNVPPPDPCSLLRIGLVVQLFLVSGAAASIRPALIAARNNFISL